MDFVMVAGWRRASLALRFRANQASRFMVNTEESRVALSAQ
jgi:hypothetical protein